MKIDLSKIKSTTSANTSAPSIVPKFSSEVTAANEAAAEAIAPTNTGITYDQSVTSPASNESENSGFSVTFTSGATYDLDRLIAEKKRNSSTCPLILKVDSASSNDEKVIAQIVKLILYDYGISYSDDETADDYYEKQITKVPDYYNVFDFYFNKMYAYYYSQLNSLQEGSIGLSTVLETITDSLHAEVLATLTTGTSEDLASESGYLNKTKVDWELGTQESTTETDAVDEINDVKDKLSALTKKLNDAVAKFGDATALTLNASVDASGHKTFFWYDASKYNKIAGTTGYSEDKSSAIIDLSLDPNITATQNNDNLIIQYLYNLDEHTGEIICYGW